MSKIKVFFVCEYVAVTSENPTGLEMVGVFSSKVKAVAECKTEKHFYGEFEIDKANHEKGVPWMISDPFPHKNNNV